MYFLVGLVVMKLTKKDILIGVLLLIVISGAGYYLADKLEFCETSKNISYQAGYNQGVEYWNKEVIMNMIQFDIVPYWVNNSKYYVNLTMMVKESCGDL